ncbi:MAG: hypothetical protein IKJ80_06620 [Clostridia bacterium]|nr:hypothetical protein [Clostridia bacterium]
MFGYVRPHVPALRVAEYEYYRAIYCGICKSHSEASGSASRLALSYDAVFLALARLVLTGGRVTFSRQRCAANPLLKRACAKNCEETRYAAAATSLLTALKFDDDLTDEQGMRRFAARLGRLASSGWKRKVGKHYPTLIEPVSNALEELYRAENAAASAPDTLSLDILASLFGKVLSIILSHGMTGQTKQIAEAVGMHVGRWIYFIDALDDLKKDAQRGRFNPFLIAYSSDVLSDEEKRTVACMLDAEAAAALAALDLSDRSSNPDAREILDNVLGIGLPRVTAAVLDGSYRKPRRDNIEKNEEKSHVK